MKILLYSLSSIRKHCTWHHRRATSFALIGKPSLLHLCASPSSTNIFLKSLIWRQQNDWSVHENILLAMTMMKNKKYWKRIQTVYPCKYSGVSLIRQCWHQHSLRIFSSSLWSLWWRWRFNTEFQVNVVMWSYFWILIRFSLFSMSPVGAMCGYNDSKLAKYLNLIVKCITLKTGRNTWKINNQSSGCFINFNFNGSRLTRIESNFWFVLCQFLSSFFYFHVVRVSLPYLSAIIFNKLQPQKNNFLYSSFFM